MIGSGATAATLVPAIADEVDHVTILQRSPTYFFPGQNTNELADTLRELDIPDEWTHEIVRRKILKEQHDITRLCFDYPELAREELLNTVRKLLPEGYDVEKHFGPRYRPWQQRSDLTARQEVRSHSSETIVSFRKWHSTSSVVEHLLPKHLALSAVFHE